MATQATQATQEENTFAQYLVAGGMKSESAFRLSDFFEFRDWTQLWSFTDKVIDDIAAKQFADASGDLVLPEPEIEQLRRISEFCRKERTKRT